MLKRASKTALKVAMIGTRGMPANYGGVETVVDVLARELCLLYTSPSPRDS